MTLLALDWLPIEVFYSAVGFTAVFSFLPGMFALASGSFSVAAVVAYTAFAFIAMNANIELMSNVFITTLVLFTVGFAFKIWRLEGTEG